MNLQQYNQAKKELKQNPSLIHDKDFNYNINELKNSLMKKFLFSLFLAMTVNAAYAVGDEVTPGKLVELNTIVAIVNEAPILQDTLDQRVNMVERQLESRNIPLPPLDILKNQVLNQLIQEQLQLQLAESRHIQIPQAQVNEQLQKIADQQKITIAELYQQATLDGFTRDSYREQLQDQMRIHELIQTTIAAKILRRLPSISNFSISTVVA